MTDRNTKIRTSQLKDDDIKPIDLSTSNSPVDGYKLVYKADTEEFKWEESGSLFEFDVDGNLVPISGTGTDPRFELNGSDDIVPKA